MRDAAATCIPDMQRVKTLREHHEADLVPTMPAAATWLPLLAAYILAIVLWLPAARLACWTVLWACYALGSEPAPPAPYTFWAH